MYLREKSPLPLNCQECIKKQEETKEFDDCYNCDTALERWEIIHEEGDRGWKNEYRP